MFVYDKDVENLFRKCNVQLQNLYEWFLSNKLSLNSEKCIYSVFGKESNTINDTYAVIINNKILKREKSVKYLGILIDEKLLWEEHIQYVTNKLIKYSSIFYKLRAIVPHQVLKTLYFALVHPHLLYGVELFGNAPVKYLDPLIKLNNKLLRIAQNRRMDTRLKLLYSVYNTLPIPELHEFQIILLMHRYEHFKSTLPTAFQNLFILNKEIHKFYTRQSSTYHLTIAKTKYGRRLLGYSGPRLWNTLPYLLRINRGKFHFKKLLKKKMIQDSNFWSICFNYCLIFIWWQHMSIHGDIIVENFEIKKRVTHFCVARGYEYNLYRHVFNLNYFT